MRYQRISPDSQSLSNGRRVNSNPNLRTFKEDEERVMEEIINGTVETRGALSRFRSPTPKTQQQDVESASNSSGNFNHGGDVFLQWGHRKRSRCSRGMVMAAAGVSSTTAAAAAIDDSSSSSSAQFLLQPNKLQRRSSAPQPSTANNTNENGNATMPPPSSLPSSNGVFKGPNIKPSPRTASSTASPVRRGSEERSGGAGGTKSPPGQSGGGGSNINRVVASRSRAAGKKSPSCEKKNTPSSPGPQPTRGDGKMNGCSLQLQHQQQRQHNHHPEEIMPIDSKHAAQSVKSANNNDDGGSNDIITAARMAGGGGEKMVNGLGEINEWPRIYIALSRKEKEEDFLAMKGTKLPHRPKKRPKAVDKMLQYCFPGMWLSDLTRGRYEVREKKCTKKQKRRGLKGMESMESDSE